MSHCIEAVKAHVGDLVRGLAGSAQDSWDVRLDFIAHSATAKQGHDHGHLRHLSVCLDSAWHALYKAGQGRLFTTDVREFVEGLARVTTKGDEATLVALDFCLDFPWRPAAECHRVVIMLTDEPFEQGLWCDWQRQHAEKLLDKIEKLKVLLYFAAPASAMYSRLAQVQRSEFFEQKGQGDGLARLDFARLFDVIGQSVSGSRLQQVRGDEGVERGIYGQANWGTNGSVPEWVGE
jgi:hypothetical protein